MSKIKLCGLSRETDISYANFIMPEFVGFVFAVSSKRYVTPEKALRLRKLLRAGITPVGVFVDEAPETIAEYVKSGIIDVVQLHGSEDDDFIRRLRELTNAPVIKAFRIKSAEDVLCAESSSADIVLLDSGCGTGKTFDHSLIESISRPYFLAGGLTPENVGAAVESLRPYAVDASSSLESEGVKDYSKMKAFADAVRRKDE